MSRLHGYTILIVDDDLDIRVIGDLFRISGHRERIRWTRPQTTDISNYCMGHHNTATRATADLLRVAMQYIHDSTAYGAKPDDSDVDRFHIDSITKRRPLPV